MASSTGLSVFGDAISEEELRSVLAEKFPDRKFSVAPLSSEENIADLEEQLAVKAKECTELESAAGKAMLTIDVIQQQQQSLFDDFVLLRARYDEQKTTLLESLWIHCASHHPGLENIPMAEDYETFVETDSKLGTYNIEETLGEGQFATVMGCWKDGATEDERESLALKIIKKERITTFASLKRLSNEVYHLKSLRSPYVVKISDCVHTQNRLYIVTERGGADLFDFFDSHPEGVDPIWAKEIVAYIMKGVTYIHRRGVCHRDLKPENILLSDDTDDASIKLADFGLSKLYNAETEMM